MPSAWTPLVRNIPHISSISVLCQTEGVVLLWLSPSVLIARIEPRFLRVVIDDVEHTAVLFVVDRSHRPGTREAWRMQDWNLNSTRLSLKLIISSVVFMPFMCVRIGSPGLAEPYAEAARIIRSWSGLDLSSDTTGGDPPKLLVGRVVLEVGTRILGTISCSLLRMGSQIGKK